MAEPQDREEFGMESATPESSAAPEKARGGKKQQKKKKKRGCGFFILLLLLAAGTSAGLQLSGSVDFRPFVYNVVPKLPKIGDSLKSLLNIPDVYSLTTEERRRMELEEWEAAITDSVRSIDARQKALEKVSRDLSLKERDLVRDRDELAARIEALSNDMASNNGAPVTDSQQAEIGEIIGTFGQMSVRNAAAIVEKLNTNLAVAILDGMPEDTRASVLQRIEAATAAALTERLTELYKNRK